MRPINNKSSPAVPKLRFPEFQNAEGWKEKPLESKVSFLKGKGLSKKAITPDGNHVCIHYGELFTDYSEVISCVNSRTNEIENCIFSIENDVLMPDSDVTPNGLAKACCLKIDNVILGGGIIVIRADKSLLCGEFLSRLIRSYEKQILRLVSGSTVFHLYASSLKRLNLPFPSISEQQKTADCLTSLDALITTQTQKLQALQQHKKGLMQNLFPAEGKTTPKLRFPEFKNSGEWMEKKLGKVGEFVGGGTPSTSNPEYWDGDIQWYTPTEVKNRPLKPSIRTITEEGLKNSSAKLLPQGTILITTRATIGDAAIANHECTNNQGFQSLIVKKTEVNIFWYYWILLHKYELERRSSGSTFKEIGKNEIKVIPTLSPEKQEQQKIADCLSSLDALITIQTQKLQALQQHKKGLMQGLFPIQLS